VTEDGSKPVSFERTGASIAVAASIDQCFKVGIDLDAYPEWVEGISGVEVLTRSADGTPATVRFEAEAMGRQSSYVLAYDLSSAPNQISWSLVEGDLAREIEGAYVFAERPSDGQAITQVDYELTIDLAVPLPGFVKRRAEDKIVASACLS